MEMATIEEAALQLTDSERALLADRLIESLSPVSLSLRAAWIAEADERMQAFQDGKITAVDGPAAVAELRDAVSANSGEPLLLLTR